MLTKSEDFFLMSNLSPKQTGLPFVVWVSPKGESKHDVRLKISMSPKVTPEELITVAIRPEIRVIEGKISAKEFKLLKAWIELNHQTLINFWDGLIEYTKDVLDLLKPLEGK